MAEVTILRDISLRRKEILEKVSDENREYAESYLKHINVSAYERTTISSKIQMLLHYLEFIADHLNNKSIKDISVSEMEDYLLYLGNECNLEPNSIAKHMSDISVFYKFLISKGVSTFNPIYYIPKPHKLKTEDHRLNAKLNHTHVTY